MTDAPRPGPEAPGGGQRPNIFPTEIGLGPRRGSASSMSGLHSIWRPWRRLFRLVRRGMEAAAKVRAPSDPVGRTDPDAARYGLFETSAGWLRERHAPGAGFDEIEGDATHNTRRRDISPSTSASGLNKNYHPEKFVGLSAGMTKELGAEMGETTRDRLNAVVLLKEMLMQLEREIGLDELPEVERSIVVAAHSLSEEPGTIIEAERLRNHWLVAPLAQATYYRGLKNLLSLGFMRSAEGSMTKFYVLQHNRLSK